jgi:[acyl-carrier-protein] S-malonyltransferase
MTLALLFPGQGVQHAAMLPWLEAEPLAMPLLAAVAAQLGDDWRTRLSDEEWASRNEVAQALLTGVSLAAWAALAPRLPRPSMVAGYSVGELAACSAAGAFDAPTAVRLAAQRAELMDRSAGDDTPGGLLAVSGVHAAQLDELCARFGLAVAIRIGVDRGVIGGPLVALDAIAPALIARGGELTRLRVRVASHTPAMAAAARAFAALIDPMPWQRSTCVVVCDLDGAGRRDAASLKRALAQQIDHPLEWGRCLETLAERQPRCVLEVGPGSSLARMWSAAVPDVPVRSVDEFQSAAAVVDWVQRTLADARR